LQISGHSGHKEWGYRKTAWIIDDLTQNIKIIYQEKGFNGLKEIKGVGEVQAKRIEELLTKIVIAKD